MPLRPEWGRTPLDTRLATDLPAVSAPTLDEDALAELAPFGRERTVEGGEVLYRAGDDAYDFYVLLEGTIDIIRPDREGETLITSHGVRGRFIGEMNLLTGQRPYLTVRARTEARVLQIPWLEFRRVMNTKPDIADVIFAAFVLRREILRAGEGARAVRIIGSRYSREATALRAFASRARVPHEWTDLEDEADAEVMLANLGFRMQDTPVVVTTAGVLRHPTPAEFAAHLGLTYRKPPGFTFDLVIVGSGPAGLAAAVYGASEGLKTVSLDKYLPGGQAGSSSRIENYVGFPSGISGEDLVTRAALQAQRLGAHLNAPCLVSGLRVDEGFKVVMLEDGSEIPARAVIIASGARYQRLAVDDLERFEGAGVYYAATDLEARVCSGQPVTVVGGGNSAGQAALYLAQQGCAVSLVIRGDDLGRRMSRYLVSRIEADPRIELFTHTEVRALDGDDRLHAVTLEHTPSEARRTVECAGLFCFIGAFPSTSWLRDCVELDAKGFVLTDRSLPARSPSERAPLPFETSIPGVFAVGDVRSGSVKRVAAAVGEGSSAVRFVHEYLASVTG